MSEALNVNMDFIEATKNKIKNVPAPCIDPIDYTRNILSRCKVIGTPTRNSSNLLLQT